MTLLSRSKEHSLPLLLPQRLFGYEVSNISQHYACFLLLAMLNYKISFLIYGVKGYEQNVGQEFGRFKVFKLFGPSAQDNLNTLND